MGIAEITPGISGATIAGLFNVYKDFVNFLNVFNPFKIKPNLSYFYKEINFSFIIPLLSWHGNFNIFICFCDRLFQKEVIYMN